MTANIKWLWALSIVVLLIVAILGAVFAWSRYAVAVPVEISITQPEDSGGSIYIGDGVALPGFYPFTPDDTISDLLQAAGGVNSGVDLGTLRLNVLLLDEDIPQKVDINRAESWLLQALPGIGETLAQRIIDYRLRNGPFPDTSSLTKISGIGNDEYSKIKDLITVSGD